MKSTKRLISILAVIAMVLSAAPEANASYLESTAAPCVFSGTLFPGDSISRICTIQNNSATDGDFYIYIDQSNLVVRDANNQVVTGPDRATFIGFFDLSVSTERFVTTKNPFGVADLDVARVPYPNYKPVCINRPLTSLTSVTTGCRVGRVRKAGTSFDSRSYEEVLTFRDSGDQTPYIGWSLGFAQIVTACAGTNCPGNNHILTDEL